MKHFQPIPSRSVEQFDPVCLRAELEKIPPPDCYLQAQRWRRLVKLVANGAADGDAKLLADAIAEIRRTADGVSRSVLCSTAFEISRLSIPAELVAVFALQPLEVAAAVLATARLTVVEWASVTAGATAECASFLRMGGAPGASTHRILRWIDGTEGAALRAPRAEAGPPKHLGQRGSGQPARPSAFKWPVEDLLSRIREVAADKGEIAKNERQRERADGRGSDEPRIPLHLVKDLLRAVLKEMKTIVHVLQSVELCKEGAGDVDLGELSARAERLLRAVQTLS